MPIRRRRIKYGTRYAPETRRRPEGRKVMIGYMYLNARAQRLTVKQQKGLRSVYQVLFLKSTFFIFFHPHVTVSSPISSLFLLTYYFPFPCSFLTPIHHFVRFDSFFFLYRRDKGPSRGQSQPRSHSQTCLCQVADDHDHGDRTSHGQAL